MRATFWIGAALLWSQGLSACCNDREFGLRVLWDNGLERPVRFGCGDARVVQPLGRDRTGYTERTGTLRVPLCFDDESEPFATALVTVRALPTCDPGRDLEVVLRLEPAPDGWEIRLPNGEDAAVVEAGFEGEIDDEPVDTDPPIDTDG